MLLRVTESVNIIVLQVLRVVILWKKEAKEFT